MSPFFLLVLSGKTLRTNVPFFIIFVVDLSQYKMKKRHNSLLYNLLCRY